MKETSDQNTSYQKFWTFFSENKETFFQVVKSHEDIEEKFLDIIAPELKSINEDLLYLTGMFDENTAELIITVDGNIKDIVYAEELIEAAPSLENWRFTALKPESDIKNTSIIMEDFEFEVADGRLLDESDEMTAVFGGQVAMSFYNPKATVWREPKVDLMKDKLVITLNPNYGWSDPNQDTVNYKSYKIKVAGILTEDNYEYSYAVYMPMADVKKMIKEENAVLNGF